MPMLEIIHSDMFLPEQKKLFASDAMEIFNEILGTPTGRLRLYFQTLTPENTIEGLLSESDQQPSSMLVLRLSLLEGRPEIKRAALIHRLSELAADQFSFPLAEIRFALIELQATNWGIGGVTIAKRQRTSA